MESPAKRAPAVAALTLHLVALAEDLVAAWKAAFGTRPDVRIHCANIVDVAEDTVVSPANSYGDMGGGVDLVYRNFFGRSIENSVQAAIAREHGPYLPIGEALLVDTQHERIPRLIAAPTMFLPEPTTVENVRLAFTAVLRVATENRDVISNLYCPGMGTGIGLVAPADAAGAMLAAYEAKTAHP